MRRLWVDVRVCKHDTGLELQVGILPVPYLIHERILRADEDLKLMHPHQCNLWGLRVLHDKAEMTQVNAGESARDMPTRMSLERMVVEDEG